MPQSKIQTLSLGRKHNVLVRISRAVTTALARRRDRARLARLDTHLLRDIGIDAEHVQRECAKPFWQA